MDRKIYFSIINPKENVKQFSVSRKHAFEECKSQYINAQKTENINVQISATLLTEFPEKFAFPGVCMTDLLLKQQKNGATTDPTRHLPM